MTDTYVYYPAYDWHFVTGDYKYIRILFEDPDPLSVDPDNPDMIPRDWTDWSVRAQVRKDTKRDTTITAEFACSFLSDGFLLIEIMPTESAKVLKAEGWDLELTDPSGNPETVLGGKVYPKLDYTR